MKTIIVEDEGIMALFLKETLEELGHEVIFLFNRADSLLDYLHDNDTVDLILMDILIKGNIDGIQLGQRIKEKYNHISLVFITSFKDSDTIQNAQLAYPLGYLIKPIEKSDLEAVLMVVNNARKKIDFYDSKMISLSKYSYDKQKKCLYENDKLIHLSEKEKNCLNTLVQNRNSYCSSEQLIQSIWGNDLEYTNSSLRELMYRIRKKLPNLKIVSTPNVGYTIIE